MSINYKEIGRRIREERLKQCITQERLAELANLSVPHVSHIETANTKLSLPTIVNIANALNVSVDTFLCDSIENSKHIFNNEIASILSTCNEYEIRIASEVLKATINSIRKNITNKNTY